MQAPRPEEEGGDEEEEEEEEEGREEGEGAASEATSVSSAGSPGPSPAANGIPGPRGGKEAPGGLAGELQGPVGAVVGEDRLSSALQDAAPSPEWHECPECGRGFGTSRALKVHRSYHIGRKRPHSGGGGGSSGPSSCPSPGAKPPPPPQGAPSRGRAFHYICAECGLGFASPASLEGHRCEEHGWRQHHQQQQQQRGALPRHTPALSPSPVGEQANGGDTREVGEAEGGPYHCTECPGEFGRVSQLHQHYMLHARGEL